MGLKIETKKLFQKLPGGSVAKPRIFTAEGQLRSMTVVRLSRMRLCGQKKKKKKIVSCCYLY